MPKASILTILLSVKAEAQASYLYQAGGISHSGGPRPCPHYNSRAAWWGGRTEDAGTVSRNWPAGSMAPSPLRSWGVPLQQREKSWRLLRRFTCFSSKGDATPSRCQQRPMCQPVYTSQSYGLRLSFLNTSMQLLPCLGFSLWFLFLFWTTTGGAQGLLPGSCTLLLAGLGDPMRCQRWNLGWVHARQGPPYSLE